MKPNPHWNTILIVAAVGIAQATFKLGPPSMWQVIAGVILICLLATCKVTPTWSFQETAVLSTLWGLTVINTCGIGLQRLANPDSSDVFFFFVWAMISVAAYVGITFSLNRQMPKGVLTPPSASEEPPSTV